MAEVTTKHYNRVVLVLPPGAGLVEEPFVVERSVATIKYEMNVPLHPLPTIVGVRCLNHEEACEACVRRYDRGRCHRGRGARSVRLRENYAGRVTVDGTICLDCRFLCGTRCMQRHARLDANLVVAFYVVSPAGWFVGTTLADAKYRKRARPPHRVYLRQVG